MFTRYLIKTTDKINLSPVSSAYKMELFENDDVPRYSYDFPAEFSSNTNPN